MEAPVTLKPTCSSATAFSSSSFVYSPLKLKHDYNFRLLILLPGDWDEQIQCTLTHNSRRKRYKPYEVISYTWGTDKSSNPILLNGLALQVTESLEAALRHLRYPKKTGKSRTLWADAICINQYDVAERNHQVRQMGAVYSRAQTVLVWLGEASSNSDLGMAFMKELCDCLAEQGIIHTDSQNVRLHSYLDANLALEKYLGTEYDRHWQAAARILRRPWWGRAWVIQELACSTRALFYCGTWTMEWRHLELIIWLLSHGGGFFEKMSEVLLGEDTARLFQLAWNRYYFRRWIHTGFHLLHQLSSYQSCEDPRDKVYAMLALTDAETKANIQVDYSQSVAWVYTMATKVDIVSNKNLSILESVEHGTEPLDIPSWVADWRQKVSWHSISNDEVSFNASGSDSFASPSCSEDLQTLYVDGFRIGVVEDCNVPQAEEEFSWLDDKGAYSWDMEAMVKRLVEVGGVTTWDKEGITQQPGNSRRSVQRALYDVLIAGQLDVDGRWKPHQVTFSSEVETDDEQPELWHGMLYYATQMTHGRTVILSTNRLLGLAPLATRAGDHIFILYGLNTPIILRPREDGAYTVVGVAYIHSVMDGEALSGLEDGTFHDERLALR